MNAVKSGQWAVRLGVGGYGRNTDGNGRPVRLDARMAEEFSYDFDAPGIAANWIQLGKGFTVSNGRVYAHDEPQSIQCTTCGNVITLTDGEAVSYDDPRVCEHHRRAAAGLGQPQ